MRLKALVAGVAAFGVCVALALPLLAWVPDDAMAPSLLPGDLVVIWPRTPAVGEVGALADPLDPEAWTLRRVLADSGGVRFEDGFYRTEGEPAAVLDMGTLGEQRVLQEADWLTQRLTRPVRWEMGLVTVPNGKVWLAADNRDGAADSRWWGPAPRAAVQGTVVLRIGRPGHRWRGWVDTDP